MKISEMIVKLQQIKDLHGDLELVIADCHSAVFYHGDHDVVMWEDIDRICYVNIGVGGCNEACEKLEL